MTTHEVLVTIRADEYAGQPFTDEDLLAAVRSTLHEVFPTTSDYPVVPEVTVTHGDDYCTAGEHYVSSDPTSMTIVEGGSIPNAMICGPCMAQIAEQDPIEAARLRVLADASWAD